MKTKIPKRPKQTTQFNNALYQQYLFKNVTEKAVEFKDEITLELSEIEDSPPKKVSEEDDP